MCLQQIEQRLRWFSVYGHEVIVGVVREQLGPSLEDMGVVLDEAFRTIYAGESVDFRQFKKQDLPGLSKQIGDNVNKRLGTRLVDDVLVQELNYIAKDHVRGGLKN